MFFADILFDIFVGDTLDGLGERTVVAPVIHTVPFIVPVSFEEVFGFDVGVFPDPELLTGHPEISINPRAVSDDDFPAVVGDLDSDVGDSLTIDGGIEVCLVEDVIVLPENYLILDAESFELLCEDIGGIAATSGEEPSVENIIIDFRVHLFNDVVSDVGGFHIFVFLLFPFFNTKIQQIF